MPLKIELAPFEKIYLGRSLLQNGSQRWKFVVESHDVDFVRGRDIMTSDQADTPAKRLYAAVFEAFLSDASVDHEFMVLAKQVTCSDEVSKPLLAEAFTQILAGKLTIALRPLKKLIQQEALELAGEDGLADVFQHEPVPPDEYKPSRHDLRRRAQLLRPRMDVSAQ